ncbi:hypothetical protein WICMUC_000656 [Wickerhamomyces mucosus]|uniref:Uncharacterized protein n=1 Tax=Wickerhamomyces mucosus TaxID=1378264 RepID=A0A9P8PX42_9ASCO|nr:hypothetical protein WICMUC_000656 [Wickerhamomyces mucosus]
MVVPASVAKSAAINLVVIPPVPTSLPLLEVLTFKSDISSTTNTGLASGLALGLSVYKHSTSVIRNK